MRNLWKSVLGLLVIGMGFGMSAPAHAASGVGPYYAMPAWDQTLPAATRFIDLTNMPGAVLDRETGLVWEKVPSTSSFNWFSALFHCGNLNLGGRTGWRLPARAESLSIVDRSQSSPSLPSGHPFTVQSSGYWSATTIANINSTTGAWRVFFDNGDVENDSKSFGSNLAWCVRGGPGVDPQ